MLSATGVTFAYDSTLVLRGVSIEVSEGGLVGILGPWGDAVRAAGGYLSPAVRFTHGRSPG